MNNKDWIQSLLQGLDTSISTLYQWTVSGQSNEHDQIALRVGVWILLCKSLKKEGGGNPLCFPLAGISLS